MDSLLLYVKVFYVNISSFISKNFQEFDDYRDADDAVYELNGKELLGER